MTQLREYARQTRAWSLSIFGVGNIANEGSRISANRARPSAADAERIALTLRKETLRGACRTQAADALDAAAGELRTLADATERQVQTVTEAFQGLAGHTETIVKLAAAIVGCVEKENISEVLPKVKTLGSAAKLFIEDRLRATTGILETVTAEVELLHQLSLVTLGQKAIAFEIKALSVLTNIEVAHLGSVGAGFQYLANELADFSKSVIDDTQELASHTENRKNAIEETKSVLSADLPRQREELARLEVDLDKALAAVDFSLTQLSATPAQFKICVEEIAAQIAGVVTAIQAHDITRQQIEHVQAGLTLVAARLRDCGARDAEVGTDVDVEVEEALAVGCAGLTIQTYQLRLVRETVGTWASQITQCMGGILKVSASEVVSIGPAVLQQEREVSFQLSAIQVLEQKSQAYSEKIQGNLGGLASLMQLVSDHVQRSKAVRDRLRLLTFNSIIEASRLGAKADTILAIADGIKDVSREWEGITQQSEKAMQQILGVVKQTNEVMGVFSDASNQKLREAQAQTNDCLENLRNAAVFAARQAEEMKVATGKMQAQIALMGKTQSLSETCSLPIDVVVQGIERIKVQLAEGHPDASGEYDMEEVQKIFSSSYTTEIEREVLLAALAGAALPTAQQNFAGNSVELF